MKISRPTNLSDSSSPKLTERSPKVRRLLGHYPWALYLWGYVVILFCVAVFLLVMMILGNDRLIAKFE